MLNADRVVEYVTDGCLSLLTAHKRNGKATNSFERDNLGALDSATGRLEQLF